MKSFFNKYFTLFILIVILAPITGFPVFAEKPVIEVSGKVKNSKNKKIIANASVSVPGSNIATVTNEDGFFNLKIPASFATKGIKAEQIGFQSKIISSNDINPSEGLEILLDPTGKVLKEVLVLGGDPREIVEEALRKIPENYSNQENLFSGFYRETVRKGNRFINISEALVDVLKKPYNTRTTGGEKVGINRGRTILSPKASDTLSVKIMGGPYMPVMLDAVKNGDHLFRLDEIDNFEFKMAQGAMINDRIHYAIDFKPKVEFSYPLNSGTFYIDGEDLTISRVEFQLDMKDKWKVTRSILQKKPSGLNFKPLEVSGVVTYKNIDGKAYINYISSIIKFKCDWKKRLFASTYTTSAEMVMVDRVESPDKSQKFKESFGSRKIFSDYVDYYWDEDFWKDYNIIEPTESLEKAVDKLKKASLKQ